MTRQQRMSMRSFWVRFALPSILILAGYYLRILRLDDKSIWWDEGYTAWLSRATVSDILLKLVPYDTSPPLHYLLLHGWRQLAGESPFALRYFSVLAGVVTLAVIYQIGNAIAVDARFKQPAILGLFSTLLLTINRFHISWSQEIRNYALGSFVATLAVWAALRLWQRQIKRSQLRSASILYVFAMAATLFTNYLGAFFLLSINIAWLWEWAKRDDTWRQVWRWSLAQAAVLAIFLPWLAFAIGRMQTWDADSRVDLATFAKVTWTTLNIGIPANFEQFYPLTIPLFLLFLLGLFATIWHGRQNWRVGRNLTLTLIGLLIPGILIFLLTLPGRDFLYTPPVAPRYFMFFVAIYCVGLAWCLMTLSQAIGRSIFTVARISAQRIVAVGIGSFMLWVAFAGLQPYYKTRDIIDRYQSLTATIHAHERQNDAVVLFPDTDWPTFDFYYGAGWHGVSNSWLLDDWQTNAFIAPIWESADGVWLVTAPHAPITDPNKLMEQWLGSHAVATEHYDFGEHTVTFYAKTEARASRLDQVSTNKITIRYQGATTSIFKGHDRYISETRSGDSILLGLYFDSLPDSSLENAVVGLRMADGSILTQQELNASSVGTVRQAIRLSIPAEAETGTYVLSLWLDGTKEALSFGRIHITQRFNTFLTLSDINPTQRVNETFANGIELIGFDLDSRQSFSAGSQIPLTLYWKSNGSINTTYKVFTHLLGDVYNADQNNFLWGQQDNQPENGKRPTPSWRADEIIIDRYAIPFQLNAPAGRYRIEIGLYDPISGERLLLTDGRDHLILDFVDLGQ